MKHDALDLDAPGQSGDAEATVIQRAMGEDALAPAARARLQQAAMQALEPLLRELGMTVDALNRPSEKFERVVLIGGTSRMRGFDGLIEDTLGIPVTRPSLRGPLWGEHITDERIRDLGLPAMALALEQIVDARGHRVNLRRGDLGGLSDFSAIRAKAGWIAAFLALLIVVFFVRKAVRISTLEGHEQLLAEKLDEQSEKLLGEKPDTEVAVVDRFRNMREAVGEGSKAETEQIYPQMTAFRIFYDVTRVQREVNLAAEPPKPGAEDPMEEDEDGLPKPPSKPAEPAPAVPAAEKHQIELSSFAAEVKSPTSAAATLGGSGFDIVTIENFVSKLRAHKCFKQVDRQETKKTNNPARPGWTDFTIKIDVGCSTPIEPKTAKTEPTEKGKSAEKTEGE
jgi:hypothetical protein